MYADFLLDICRERGDAPALVWRDQAFSYTWLLQRVAFWQAELPVQSISAGVVVTLEADFSPDALAALLALIDCAAIIVPLGMSDSGWVESCAAEAIAQVRLRVQGDAKFSCTPGAAAAEHPLYQQLRDAGHPGLLLFSSGSTGKSKGAVHDMTRLLQKFRTRRHNLRTLAFLLFDHIGGIDTLLYSLSNGSCLITTEDRSPEAVCRLIEKYQVEVLPVSPSFLNLLLIKEAYRRYDLSSLKYITYGAEVMPESTLKRCAALFPAVTLLQKYGTTETGTLRSRSRSSDSLWVKLGGEGYQTRVVNGVLQIKAAAAILGYLNAPSPFTDDGWFITRDAVEVDGDYFRILGRQSDLINVGGDKVYPAEVENVIAMLAEVAEVTVYGEANPLLGNIVCARVTARDGIDGKVLVKDIKRHCREHLLPFKVPVRIKLTGQESQLTNRFKKKRH